MKYRYYNSSDLLDRVCNASTRTDRVVTFLVGSPISFPDFDGDQGVPGVSDMISIIRQEFQQPEAQRAFDSAVGGEPALRYSSAFEFLHGRRGPEAANRIVRAAVWQALDPANWPPHLPKTSPTDADSATCQVLEETVDAWILPQSVHDLGRLLSVHTGTFGRAVLTTNFDPLIEVSIRKYGGYFYSTVLHGDGRLGQTFGRGTHVVHLHGYWYGYDTLHTPQQLRQPRPGLKRSLARVLEESILVVVGYGGWDDVITQTLLELLSDPGSKPEIMWAFHADDAKKVEASNVSLLNKLQAGISQERVSLYINIDCRTLFGQILDNMDSLQGSAQASNPLTQTSSQFNKSEGRATRSPALHVQVRMPALARTTAESDQPLIISPWVGREAELNILTSATTPVAFVTGLGGQGKSALAGRLLQQQALSADGRFDFWDWRDCREESDRLNTQVLRLVERLSEGHIQASQIETTNIQAVVGMLFPALGDRHALLVFDNVDQYVNLETLEPIRGLDVFIAEIRARRHNSLFLFTCRPDVRVDEARAVNVPLAGLSEDNTRELILAHKALQRDEQFAEELHRLTNGHPLWINLILMQAVRHGQRLRGVLDLVKRGGSSLPSTTKTIWDQLSKQQRDVLRTMAELDRPEAESKLVECLPGLNANRVNRTLKTLKSFYLIETRTRSEGEPLLGLHPIIREFIRRNYPKEEREKHVEMILNYLDRMMGRFRGLLEREPSYDILEYWVRKADLQIAISQFEEATLTIGEIASALVSRGYTEEFVRVSARLIRECDLAEACSSYKGFDDIFERSVTNMIQMGHDAVEEQLARYEEAIPGKSTQFILLCDLRCYSQWYRGNQEAAIRWGEEGERLKGLTPIDTAFSTRHNLALARRDAGRLEEALNSFLEGESLEEVIGPSAASEERGAPFYGNIGRCLFLMDELDDAIPCHVKSARLLEKGHSRSDNVNKGYIRHWIAELMLRQGECEFAAAFYRCAECSWNECSPPRAKQAQEKLLKLVAESESLSFFVNKEDWKVEEMYRRWLSEQ